MEGKIASARLSPFKQPGGFKQLLQHFEVCKGLQPSFAGCSSAEGIGETLTKTSWHFDSSGHVHRFLRALWAHLKQFFMKASAKMPTPGLSLADSGITRSGQQAHSR